METEPFTVHRLADGDAELAERLNALLGEAFADPATYQGNPPARAYLAELLGKDEMIVLVGFAHGELVGGLVAYELPKLESVAREIYIYDLAVREAYRRKGIATALIENLKHIARTRGAGVIFVQADYDDDPAIALYRKLGSQEKVLHFDISM